MSGGLKFGLALLASALIGGAFGLRNRGPDAELCFLAVGQGDCIVFRHAGATVLIDAGPKTDGFDAGQRIVIPKLQDLGVDGVDLILLSHPDTDHAGGVGALLRAFPNLKLAVSAEFRGTSQMKELLNGWSLAEEKVIWIGAEDTLAIGRFKLQIVDPSLHAGQSDNEGSMFVRLSDGKSSAVFSGDAGMEVEEAMLPRLNWDADIVKAGHHGSAGSSSSAWLAEVTPRYAVISCGRTNSYGHPAADALRRLEASGAEVVRTDRMGDVVFEATPSGFRLR